MQPDGSNEGGIQDSVISGDVHHHHYAAQSGIVQPQQVMIDPNTGLPTNVLIIQQPSSAPSVIGILVIIYGAISVLVSLLGLVGSSLLASVDIDDELLTRYATQLMIYSLLSLGLSIGIIVSGVWINQRKTKGIHLGLLIIVATFIISVLRQFTLPPELVQSFGTAIDLGISLVCNGICGLIVAIPLMITDNGMDDSSLLG